VPSAIELPGATYIAGATGMAREPVIGVSQDRRQADEQ